MTRYLSADEILLLHFKIIEDFGGGHGVRDAHRIESVVSAPKQTAFGGPQYLDIYQKAGVYLRNIIGDHPFSDGNKRTAVTVCGIFLMRNGYALSSTTKELEDFAVQVAVEHLSVEQIAAWLKGHSDKKASS